MSACAKKQTTPRKKDNFSFRGAYHLYLFCFASEMLQNSVQNGAVKIRFQNRVVKDEYPDNIDCDKQEYRN